MSEHVPTDNVRSLLGDQICKALGLPSNRITRLEFVIEAGQTPVLIVTRPLFGNDCSGPFTKVIEQYQITPIASAPQADSQSSTGSD